MWEERAVKDAIYRALGVGVLMVGTLSITLLPLYMMGQTHLRLQNRPPLPSRFYR
jgi:hypothetical protein